MPGGVLYVVATPIGNLEDVTLRALRILREVDLIAAEDTRHTRVLLSRHGISRPVTSYYDAVERARTPGIVEKLKAGARVASMERVRGEVTVLVGARMAPEVTATAADLDARIRAARAAGRSVADLATEIGRETGVSRRVVYRRALALERE